MNINWRISVFMVVLAAAVGYALPVTDGLIVHLEADRLNLEDGASVSVWQDSAILDSADGTVMQASGAALPTFKADGYNGLPAVHFDDVAQQALMSDVWSWDNTQGVCVIMRCTGGEANSDRAGCVGSDVGANNKTLAWDVSSDVTGAANTGSGVRYNNGWTLTATAGPNPVVEGQWHNSIRQVAAGGLYGSLFYAVDGVTPLAVTSNFPDRALAFDVDNNAVFVGNSLNNSAAWTGGSDWYYGDMAEVLIYNRELSSTEMQEVLDYLDAKYSKVTAHNPSPGHGMVNQGEVVADELKVSFSWNTGLNALGTGVNDLITEHRLYITQDPNVPDTVSPIVIPAGSPVEATASYGPITVDPDATYFWWVDEVVLDPDPNAVPGPVWSFETLSASPTILSQVEDQAAFPGDPATFTIEVFSISSLDYEWFRSGDDATDTPGDDTSMGTSSELVISEVQTSDEGYYFCQLTNDVDTVSSAVVRLGVKREIVHWTLDAADFVEGKYLDSTGTYDATPYDPNASAFVAGIDPSETGEALDIAADYDGMGAAVTDPVCTTFGTSAMTASLWVKWGGAGHSVWQGVLTNSGPDYPWNFLLEITPPTSDSIFRINAGGQVVESQTLPIDQWTHVVVSAGAEAFVFYFDGVPVMSAAGAELDQFLDEPLNLGCLREAEVGGEPAGMPIHFFNGVIDDVRVFNYALSGEEVANLYYDVTEQAACIAPPQYDIAGGGPNGDEPDCKVNLADVSALATAWLECGLRPISVCQ